MSKNEKYNSGNNNSGHRNSGHYNSSMHNSGHYNSGNYNSGHYNSGMHNSGHYNSGNYNSGDNNSGHRNSGHYNSGHYNSGNYNSGNYNSGFFNTDEPTVMLFNKDTGLNRNNVEIPYICLKTNEWIHEHKMTDQQKLNDKDFHIKKGTLITRTYKEAWALYWSEASKDDKDKFLNLPNFDKDIFLEITGVDVGLKKQEETCEGKVVEIDGKKYKLTEV
jgi:hypothetical protein